MVVFINPMRIYFLLLVLVGVPSAGFCQRTDSVTLYFGFNRWDISPATDSVLSRYIHEHGLIQRVSLAGFCDEIGGDVYNDSLSLRRALEVKRYLLRSLPDSVVGEVQGFGKRRPSGGDRAMNRRVVMMVESGAAPAPVAAPPGSLSAVLKDSTTVGKSIILKNVNFYPGRHVPLVVSYAAIDDLLKAMRDNAQLVIRIEGYVCCVPESADGIDIDTQRPNLSVSRARFVYEYLLQHGIDSARMRYTGLGGAKKIYPLERDADEQGANRRVEVRVLRK